MNRRSFMLRSLGLGTGIAVGWDSRANQRADGPTTGEAREGITPEAQRAIDAGLAHLANTQNRDGSFGDRFTYQGNVAVTSLGALALMCGGHQPGRGSYGKSVQRALEFVLSKEQRNPSGLLNTPGINRPGPMYSHGFGTLFLAEVYGMIPDPAMHQRTREALERAVRLIETTQNPEGGWRYDPAPTQADVSVTICQIMALRAARNAGVVVSADVVKKCVKYVRACQTADGGFSYFAHQPQSGSAFARSAAGVVALYSASVYEGKEIDRGLSYLMKHKPGSPAARREMDVHYFYGHYYAAQAMWIAGGKYWAEWFPAIRAELLERRRGRPDGAWSDPTICNHYATAMACIILQIPNNYLPILQK